VSSATEERNFTFYFISSHLIFNVSSHACQVETGMDSTAVENKKVGVSEKRSFETV